MGYIRHHAIIVTGSEEVQVNKAHKTALVLFEGRLVSPLLVSGMNGYCSFFVAPDGSKEFWERSNAYDRLRRAFLKWLYDERYKNNAYSLDWAEVQFGDDEGDNRVLEASVYRDDF